MINKPLNCARRVTAWDRFTVAIVQRVALHCEACAGFRTIEKHHFGPFHSYQTFVAFHGQA